MSDLNNMLSSCFSMIDRLEKSVVELEERIVKLEARAKWNDDKNKRGTNNERN